MDVGRAPGVLQRSQRGFGGQQIDPKRFALALLIAQESGRPLALQESNRASPVMMGERFLFDLRL